MPSVLLTGASGFVAIAVLKALLDAGYDVVGTVRSESKTRHIRDKFPKFVEEGKLKFATVPDMVVLGAFDDVLKENKFDAVVHTSSPYHSNVTDPKRDMLDPAIIGTTGVLESVAKYAPTVKRVVITATFGNIVNIPKGAWPGKVYTEEDWSPVTMDEEVIRSLPLMAYVAGKVAAERAVWDFVKQRNPHFTVTTLCPPNVLGPPEQELSSLKNLNTSTTDIYDVFKGGQEPRFTAWIWVDVRDLAEAHVFAITAPAAANKRYIISAGNYSAQAIPDYIWKHYPERAAARDVKKGNPGQLYPESGVYKVDNSRSIADLGLTYKYDFDTMLKDTLKKLEELEAEGK